MVRHAEPSWRQPGQIRAGRFIQAKHCVVDILQVGQVDFNFFFGFGDRRPGIDRFRRQDRYTYNMLSPPMIRFGFWRYVSISIQLLRSPPSWSSSTTLFVVQCMNRFTITHSLLVLTWCCIACVFFSRYFGHPEYLGETNDLAGSTYSARLDPALFDQKAISEMPTWHAADANPPLSASCCA